MVKTLRITTFAIITAVLIAGYFLFSAVVDNDLDPEVAKLLQSESIAARYKADSGNSNKKTDEASPLVKAATAFGLYLDPPPAPAPKVSTPSVSKTPRNMPSAPRPDVVSSKFKLIGTSYFASKPELSMALIDEPGKGFSWVRQSDKIGHLLLEEVRDGTIVLKDGQRREEMTAIRPPVRSLVRGKGSSAANGEDPLESAVKALGLDSSMLKMFSDSAPKTPAPAQNPPAAQPVSKTPSRPSTRPSTPPASVPSADQSAQMMDELLKVMQSKEGAEEGVISPDELKKMFEMFSVDGQEAQKLDNMGKDLNRQQPQPAEKTPAPPTPRRRRSSRTR